MAAAQVGMSPQLAALIALLSNVGTGLRVGLQSARAAKSGGRGPAAVRRGRRTNAACKAGACSPLGAIGSDHPYAVVNVVFVRGFFMAPCRCWMHQTVAGRASA